MKKLSFGPRTILEKMQHNHIILQYLLKVAYNAQFSRGLAFVLGKTSNFQDLHTSISYWVVVVVVVVGGGGGGGGGGASYQKEAEEEEGEEEEAREEEEDEEEGREEGKRAKRRKADTFRFVASLSFILWKKTILTYL